MTKKVEKKAEKTNNKEEKKKENKCIRTLRKVFGGLEMSWRNTIVFAIIMGIYTALMAMLVPDGNSFHDIAVTPEWWVLPAIFIIVNCKKPLEAALKTFVFFLISQPLVYLIQVPFNSMGWSLFGYYPYWFKITLAIFPGAYIGWYIKHDKWYSGIILSVMTVLLTFLAIGYIQGFSESFPNHLITVIYCFASIILYIFVIFKDKIPRLITAAITIIAIIIFTFTTGTEMFEAYNNTILGSIELEGEPYVSTWSGSGCSGKAEIIKYEGGYNLKMIGCKNHEFYITITDDKNNKEYDFKYYFDNDQNTVIVERR